MGARVVYYAWCVCSCGLTIKFTINWFFFFNKCQHHWSMDLIEFFSLLCSIFLLWDLRIEKIICYWFYFFKISYNKLLYNRKNKFSYLLTKKYDSTLVLIIFSSYRMMLCDHYDYIAWLIQLENKNQSIFGRIGEHLLSQYLRASVRRVCNEKFECSRYPNIHMSGVDVLWSRKYE